MSTRNHAAAMKGIGRPLLFAALCGLALSACAHPVPPMRNDHVIVISGKETVGDSDRSATQKILTIAARTTLGHGFRYFRIIGTPYASSRGGALSIAPGTTVTIEVYREGEIDPQNPGVWDAVNIGVGSIPSGAGTSDNSAAAPDVQSSAVRPQTNETHLKAKCTAYGCSW
ncbi:MAG: hypothetical protein KGI68_04085 [Alphaproteobacteria bacterium]|nr:hypothetical protein [Alphaproteobacteria bacterium]MDE1986275.1 hypothetical protein [Alphaproteobacteria bacterium]MDE2162709.1 hypothetical protein [Alphaproteobacteria bacterium]MDE2266655.1 hypothetical protein [Alphaproteobacteria bacterium]MDE2499617.1 hypothetical protein [Alphaproteobacteria bacterium]